AEAGGRNGPVYVPDLRGPLRRGAAEQLAGDRQSLPCHRRGAFDCDALRNRRARHDVARGGRTVHADRGECAVLVGELDGAATLSEIAGLGTTSGVAAVRCMLPVVNALFWPASWTALRPYPRSSGVRYMRFAPAAVYGLGSLFTEMRLNFVMLFALLFLCAYADRQRGRWQAPAWLAALGLTAWLLLFSRVFLAETPAFEKVEGAAEGFS